MHAKKKQTTGHHHAVVLVRVRSGNRKPWHSSPYVRPRTGRVVVAGAGDGEGNVNTVLARDGRANQQSSGAHSSLLAREGGFPAKSLCHPPKQGSMQQPAGWLAGFSRGPQADGSNAAHSPHARRRPPRARARFARRGGPTEQREGLGGPRARRPAWWYGTRPDRSPR